MKERRAADLPCDRGRGTTAAAPISLGAVEHIGDRIHRPAVDPDFVVQVVAGGASRGADITDHLTLVDLHAGSDALCEIMHVGVGGDGRQGVLRVGLGQAGEGDGMGRMQVHHGAGGPGGVDGHVEEMLLGRLVAGEVDAYVFTLAAPSLFTASCLDLKTTTMFTAMLSSMRSRFSH